MILAHDEIINAHLSETVHINPFVLECVGANSYDVHLSPTIKKLKRNCWFGIDPKKPQRYGKEIEITDKGKWIFPWQAWLACTLEEAGSTKYVPMLDGRSSIARMWLNVCQTAGFGDVGFVRQWVLELSCLIPIKLYPLMKISQVSFHTATSNNMQYGKEIKAHYANQSGPQESLYDKKL